MSKRNKRSSGLLRLLISLALLLGVLAFVALVMPWRFPYDRLEHMYGIEGVETIGAGHPGGEFVLMCESIHEDGTFELLVDGEVYAQAAYIDKGRLSVYLGPELFESPRRLELTLRERYRLPVYLRSNTIHLYVTPEEAQ